ncbi:hypothetical protein FA13DRAFT_1287934 [Coprinellus micaceus]|uniref:Uncharacterized protein n=1 Tax=Coprinellus micaceus TaxID=71717 RepID=A0A4Y7R794_COPMI|nr:hypothetical protein FA13DRAFT_1287934 [Coprinellus micaceus]
MLLQEETDRPIILYDVIQVADIMMVDERFSEATRPTRDGMGNGNGLAGIHPRYQPLDVDAPVRKERIECKFKISSDRGDERGVAVWAGDVGVRQWVAKDRAGHWLESAGDGTPSTYVLYSIWKQL